MSRLQTLWRIFALPLVLGALFAATLAQVQAADYGVHILHPGEIAQVAKEFDHVRQTEDEKIYVTIPFTLEDIGRLAEWQSGFEEAKKHNVIPLVRVSTRFNPDKNAWEVPDRRQMILLVKALSTLDWPQEQRHVILFNEPNHNAEWGGKVDPAEFAKVTTFLADWFHTEGKNYVLLPAAADLAAPNGSTTWEAFRFWQGVLAADPQYLEHFDAWNSHSYPNPGFIASPTAQGKNTLRGFEHELQFLAQHSTKKWDVYITETGWRETNQNRRQLASYYRVAHRTIWNHPQIVAVTPFVWRGSPGPFEEFSFLDEDAQPTAQWQAYAQVLVEQARQLLTQRSE